MFIWYMIEWFKVSSKIISQAVSIFILFVLLFNLFLNYFIMHSSLIKLLVISISFTFLFFTLSEVNYFTHISYRNKNK